MLSEARHHHKSLTICWLHLANVYGSVHHSLICFALNLYHAPPKFKNIVSVLHSELGQPPLCHSKLVSTKETHCQSLSSTQSSIHLLQTRRDLGYSLSNSRHKVSLLQYADDTCIVADSPASAQHLLNMVDSWLG